jgi:competence ComEA-like helix-hairpin-helix protein
VRNHRSAIANPQFADIGLQYGKRLGESRTYCGKQVPPSGRSSHRHTTLPLVSANSLISNNNICNPRAPCGIGEVPTWTADCHLLTQNSFPLKGAIVSKNIDLNTATEQELANVQGMGKDTAKKIMDYRSQNGSFKSWEDLKKIPGISGATLDTLRRNGFTIGGKAA